VLDAVWQAISAHGTSIVTTVGQSLGAALALLDSVLLRLQLPTTISVKFIGYGLPRVGNQAWANFVDARLSEDVTHINNKQDTVPIVPGMFLGYHHRERGDPHRRVWRLGRWRSPHHLFRRHQ
jgi:predicted lipase